MGFHRFLEHTFWAMLFLHFYIYIASSNPDQQFVSCYERFAIEPFLREHDSLTHSNLQEYIKYASTSQTAVPRLLDMDRHLIGEGSHRHLSSSIRFTIQPDLAADLSSETCEVIIIERLPSGVFADPFELDHLLQRGAFKDASVFGDTNLELPSFLSNRSIVEIQMVADLTKSAEQDTVNEFIIEIPLHARYPPLEENGFSTVRFGVPDLFLRCKMHEDSPNPRCLLTPIVANNLLEVNEIKWSIPAGIEAHARTVSVITFSTALFSAIVIVIASFRHAPNESDAISKQSC